MAEYVVRHGESETNVQKVFAGSGLDSPLTAKGRQQAREAGKKLKTYKITKIVSSPLKRAHKTAEIISDALGGLEILIDDRLCEYHIGDLTGKPIDSVTREERLNMPGVEDAYEFAERTLEAFLEHAHDKGNTLFVAHSGSIRILEGALEGADPTGFHTRRSPENSEIVEISAKPLREKYKKLK